MENQKLVYAVDDEASIREVYRYALEGAGFSVCCFEGGEQLFQGIDKCVPDLILLDIMLDGLDGYEILSTLRSNAITADVPVIMVSAKTTEIDKVRGLNLGADDYISKPFGVMELVARINAKLRTAKPKKQELSYKDIQIHDAQRLITVNGLPLTLTLKQYELCKLLVQHAQTVLMRDQILDEVWGKNYGETRTLDIHIGDLRKALSQSKAEIVTIRGVGYTLK